MCHHYLARNNRGRRQSNQHLNDANRPVICLQFGKTIGENVRIVKRSLAKIKVSKINQYEEL